ncbi:blue light receptor [Gonapodya sp. JEL0774]|nr:blue light receptor [Gonapodya sp. JEL0774]
MVTGSTSSSFAAVSGQSPTSVTQANNIFGLGPIRSTYQIPSGIPAPSSQPGNSTTVNSASSGGFVAPGAVNSLSPNFDETTRGQQPFTIPQHQYSVLQPPAAGNVGSSTASASTGQAPMNSSADKERVPISRHINSVINHFTSSKEGYRRLLQELDDWLFVVSPQGQFLYASPSSKKHVGYAPDDLVGKGLRGILHPEDADFVFAALDLAVLEKKDYSLYCRFIRKTGEPILLELKGKPYDSTYTLIAGSSTPDASSDTKFVINTCREYRSKASLSVDSILDLSIENIKLRRQLEQSLIARGQDPASHPLLKELESEAPQNLHPSDLFDAQEAKERGIHGMGNLATLAGFGDDEDDDEPKPFGPSTPIAGASASAAAAKKKVSRFRSISG